MSYAPVPPPLPPQVPGAAPATLAYASPGVHTLMPIAGRARAAIICLWVLLALTVLSSLAGLAFLVAYRDELRADPGATAGPAVAVDPFTGTMLVAVVAVGGLGLLFFAGFVVTVVMYCLWQYRAHANAATMTGGVPRFTPGWGVGYWFIPILHLFRPYQVVKSIDEMTPGDRGRPLGDTIAAWWALLIGSMVIGFASDVIAELSDEAFMVSIGLDVLTTLMNIVAIVLVIRIIRSISERQAAVVG